MNYFKFIEDVYPEIRLKIEEIAMENSDSLSVGGVYNALFEYTNIKFKNNDLNTIDLQKIMRIVENTLTLGDLSFQEAATFSFLENLSNQNYLPLYQYAKEYVGKNSQSTLEEIEKFWNPADNL